MGPLVTTERLAAELGAPDLRVLDATWFMPGEGRDAAAVGKGLHRVSSSRSAS